MIFMRISSLVPVPGISSIQPDSTVILTDGRQLQSIDVIIFATGFISDPAAILGFSQEILDRMQYSPKRPQDFPRYRYQLTLGLPELCLLNQIYAPTGAPVAFDIRSMWIAGVWSGNVKLPSKEEMEKQSKKEAEWLGGLYKLCVNLSFSFYHSHPCYGSLKCVVKVVMSLQGPCRLKRSTLWRRKRGVQTIIAHGSRVPGMVGSGGGTIAPCRGSLWMDPTFRPRIVSEEGKNGRELKGSSGERMV
jgi:hypothetical protein